MNHSEFKDEHTAPDELMHSHTPRINAQTNLHTVQSRKRYLRVLGEQSCEPLPLDQLTPSERTLFEILSKEKGIKCAHRRVRRQMESAGHLQHPPYNVTVVLHDIACALRTKLHGHGEIKVWYGEGYAWHPKRRDASERYKQ